MRIEAGKGGYTVLISARETTEWANRAEAVWPCSTLRGRRIRAELDRSGNLIDFKIDGFRRPAGNTDLHELETLLNDFIRERFVGGL